MIEPARTSSRARGRSATGPDRGRDLGLADERDRVDADPLAAEVVAVGLAHRAEGDLGDLRPATDDDDPLAEDPLEDARRVDLADVVDVVKQRDEVGLREALDLELDLGARLALPSGDDAGPSRAYRTWPPATAIRSAIAATASGRSTRSTRRATAGGTPGRRGIGVGRSGQRRDVTSAIVIRPGSATPVGVVGLVGQAQRVERLARQDLVARLEHQLAAGVLGDADDAGDVDASLGQRRGHPGQRAGAIVELDREPDRRGHLLCAADGTRRSRRVTATLRSGAMQGTSVQIFGLD